MIFSKRIWGDECRCDRDFYCGHDPKECPDCPEALRKTEDCEEDEEREDRAER